MKGIGQGMKEFKKASNVEDEPEKKSEESERRREITDCFNNLVYQFLFIKYCLSASKDVCGCLFHSYIANRT